MNRSSKSPVKPNLLNPPDGGRIKVAVLMGGISRERDVSIESGRYVSDALRDAGVDVVTVDISPDKLDVLDDKSIDVFFIALHGRWGEDGVLQGILESKGLVYTGSPPKASQLAFDKWASKGYFIKAGAHSPDAILFDPDKDAEIEDRIRRLGPASTRPLVGSACRRDLAEGGRGGQKYVIKPLREGSTIGISIADNAKQAVTAARKCAAEFGDCMIEEFVPGREITVGVLGKDALPILEIRARGGFYDYQAKYLDDKTEYLFDTIDKPTLTARIQKSAIDCFNALGCRGIARVDFILGSEDIPYVLEINTIPGMTSHSLLPKAAAKAGIPMSRLCLKIVEMALADAGSHRVRHRRINF